MTSLEGQLVNSQVPELAIYLRASFHHRGVNCLRTCSALVLREQTALQPLPDLFCRHCMILNSSKTSGPLSNSRAQLSGIYKTPKGGLSEPP